MLGEGPNNTVVCLLYHTHFVSTEKPFKFKFISKFSDLKIGNNERTKFVYPTWQNRMDPSLPPEQNRPSWLGCQATLEASFLWPRKVKTSVLRFLIRNSLGRWFLEAVTSQLPFSFHFTFDPAAAFFPGLSFTTSGAAPVVLNNIVHFTFSRTVHFGVSTSFSVFTWADVPNEKQALTSCIFTSFYFNSKNKHTIEVMSNVNSERISFFKCWNCSLKNQNSLTISKFIYKWIVNNEK